MGKCKKVNLNFLVLERLASRVGSLPCLSGLSFFQHIQCLLTWKDELLTLWGSLVASPDCIALTLDSVLLPQ